MIRSFFLLALLTLTRLSFAQQVYYLTADRLWDGEEMHQNWAVIVRGNQIEAVGPRESLKTPAGAQVVSKQIGRAHV